LSADGDRVPHRLGLAVQPRPELQSVERVLDEDAQLVRASRHPPRPSAWPARAPPRPTSRARTARRGSRAPGPASRLRSRRAGRARPAPPRAARAAPRPSTAILQCSCPLPPPAEPASPLLVELRRAYAHAAS